MTEGTPKQEVESGAGKLEELSGSPITRFGRGGEGEMKLQCISLARGRCRIRVLATAVVLRSRSVMKNV
eukprot:scaffold72308_cov27-Tisochrysis_lutea.AAC.1